MKRGRKLLFDTKEVIKGGPKLGRENHSPVAYDGVQKAIILYQHIYDHFC